VKRKILLIVLLFLFFITNINAYTVDSNNNPGSNYNGSSTGGGTTSSTYWPYNPIKTIRIRVFRNNNEIKNAYYSLAETSSGCYSSINGVNVCETSSYNYSKISDVDVTCANKDISLGCIASTNLTNTWTVQNYNGTYLDNYLKANSYSQLKIILDKMGYNDSNFNNNDVVIIEPATVVYCAGNPYFGTSTALMKKNVSYNSATNNLCYANDQWGGYTFYNVYNSMSQALKITTNTFNINSYSGFGFFKYDVSGFGYKEPKGTLQIKKVKSNGETIKEKHVKFYLYTDSACTQKYDDKAIEGTTGGNGIGSLVRKNLPIGTYYIQEAIDGNPDGYMRSNECKIAEIKTNGETVTIPYVNYTKCESEFSLDVNDRIDLYQKYGYRNLLNFNIENASEACSQYIPTYNNVNSCLYSEQATKNSSNQEIEFNKNNISNYNDVLKNASGTIIGYCLTDFKLEKLIGDFNTVIAGQMIVKGGNIVKTNMNQICYVFDGYNYQTKISNPKSYYQYITNIKFNNKDLTPSIDPSNMSTLDLNRISGENNLYKGNFSLTYLLDNPVYANVLTGKICLDKVYECKYIGNGIFSNFQDAKNKKGSLDFKIEGDNNIFNFSNQVCEYKVKEEIITYNNQNGELELEYRIIDTKNPFNNRTPNSNWSNSDDVKKEIIESVNSYGLDKNGIKQEPLYKITLTPSDIKVIREYNKKVTYDSYEVYCYKDKVTQQVECINAFIHDLKNGVLNKYKISNDISVIDYNIGNLQNKLLTKN